jgi:hypothetical protein
MTKKSAFRAIALGVTFLSLAACATVPPASANKPAPLAPQDLRAQVNAPHASVIEPVGAATVASAPVGKGGALLTFQYRYRHTAVLTEDVKGFSITVPGVQAPAGSPGYYAGSFRANSVRTDPFTLGDELWCFLPGAAGGKRDHICLLLNQASPGLAAIAPTSLNPYLWTSFEGPAGTNFNFVSTPIYERREVPIPGELTFAVEFDRWTATSVLLRETAVGQKVRDISLPRAADGSARVATVAGNFSISPDPNDPSKARINPSAS